MSQLKIRIGCNRIAIYKLSFCFLAFGPTKDTFINCLSYCLTARITCILYPQYTHMIFIMHNIHINYTSIHISTMSFINITQQNKPLGLLTFIIKNWFVFCLPALLSTNYFCTCCIYISESRPHGFYVIILKNTHTTKPRSADSCVCFIDSVHKLPWFQKLYFILAIICPS